MFVACKGCFSLNSDTYLQTMACFTVSNLVPKRQIQLAQNSNHFRLCWVAYWFFLSTQHLKSSFVSCSTLQPVGSRPWEIWVRTRTWQEKKYEQIIALLTMLSPMVPTWRQKGNQSNIPYNYTTLPFVRVLKKARSALAGPARDLADRPCPRPCRLTE